MRLLRSIWSILWLVAAVRLAQAEPGPICVSCQQPVAGAFYKVRSPAWGEQQTVCAECVKLDTRCFLCNLPVKSNCLRLDDGRLLCPREAAAGIFSPADAARIFESTKRELVRLLAGAGAHPDRNCTLSLVDSRQLARLKHALPSIHDESRTLGLTHTRRLGPDRFEHAIYVVSGLGPARLAAVCAHEYAHAWLHENLPPDRALHRDTIEGFCELVAYKLMVERKEDVEQKVILANAYTAGQVELFVQAEDRFQFFRVIDWIKNGADASLVESNTSRLLHLESRPEPAVTWQPQVATPVPAALVLKGISGSARRRFALINDRTFEKNELGRVRVGVSNVTLRCLDIRDHSVVIQISGANDKTELRLDAVE